MTIGITVRTNIRVKEAGAFATIKLKNASIARRIEDMSVRVLKKHAPVKTGRFRNSIEKIASTMRESAGQFQGNVRVGPTIFYRHFVIRRTAPSQGAYVPSLDRRVKFGMHPGTAANPFIRNSKPEIRVGAQKIIDNHYGKGRFDIRNFIR